jgi:molybdopterin molybdotransferase
MRGFRDRADVADVLKLIDHRLTPLPDELVGISDAAGRVLAVDMIADVDVPSFDRAAMDGYAVRGEDSFGASPYNPLEVRLIGEAWPGRGYSGSVNPGQAVRIMTGAPLPHGADAVLPAEQATEQNGIVRIDEPIPPGRHVGRRGEDIQRGEKVLARGRLVRPQDAGVLASLGVAQVSVIRKPSVDLLITGNELLPAGSRPEAQKIIDSNSVMLEALMRRDGGVPTRSSILPDQRDRIRSALLESRADVILISGGSSVGAEDHAPGLVAELGELPVHGVALRPSSPTGIGFLGHRPVFLLPGNPVSCLAAYEFFAGPALRRLGGRTLDWPHRRVTLPLAHKLVSAVGRVDYVRVRIVDGKVEPLATSGASILSSTTRADGCVIVPRDSEGYPPGSAVEVLFYDP